MTRENQSELLKHVVRCTKEDIVIVCAEDPSGDCECM
jgi:hypothetical protein